MVQALRNRKIVGLRERKKLQTRQDLLAIAQELFTENEFADVTVDQIVEMANVSQKTFFNYFQNKSQFLAQYMLDWLASIGFWSFDDGPIVDCRSAIVPPDAHDSIDWVVQHRRILSMAAQHTDFLDFIYKLDENSSTFDADLYAIIRKPRLERIELGQAQGAVRDDISATEICRMYDAVRVDVVRRWLYVADEDATAELLHTNYDTHVNALIRGIQAKR